MATEFGHDCPPFLVGTTRVVAQEVGEERNAKHFSRSKSVVPVTDTHSQDKNCVSRSRKRSNC